MTGLFLALTLALLSPGSYAAGEDGLCNTVPGRCRLTELTKAKKLNSIWLADKVAKQLTKLESEEKNQGRDFKVAIISRMGTKLGKRLHLYKDEDAFGNPRSLQGFVQEVLTPKDSQSRVRNERRDSAALKYSHMSLAFKNHISSDSRIGAWTVVHLLYRCKDEATNKVDNQSHVFQEGLASFFLDDLNDYQAEILVPSQNIQDFLETHFLRTQGEAAAAFSAAQKNSPQTPRDLNEYGLKKEFVYRFLNSRYNAAAIPDDLNEQNSNQFVLEAVAAAQRPYGEITDRSQAVQVLRNTDYRPSIVSLRGLSALVEIPLFRGFMPSTVCLKRQPYFQTHGMAQLVSALSVTEYLQRNQLILSRIELGLNPEERFSDDDFVN